MRFQTLKRTYPRPWETFDSRGEEPLFVRNLPVIMFPFKTPHREARSVVRTAGKVGDVQ